MKHSYYKRKNRYACALLLCIVCIILLGMFGYMALEGIPPLQALYMAIGTLTTISPFTLSDNGKIFSIVLLILGFGLVAASAAFLGNLLLEGSWVELYRRRKMTKRLKKFSDHYIICGHGQVGKRVVKELHTHQIPVVVIDNDQEVLLRCTEMCIPHLDKDAMDEETLIEAGVERAKGLVSVVNRDADNVYIVLTARSFNPDLFICARASSKGVESKLIRAGANRVVSPYASAAMRITQNILRPSVNEFLELALSGDGFELELEEMHIPAEAPFEQETIHSDTIRNDFDLIVVAIMREDNTWIYNPSQHEPIHRQDTVIAIGPKKNMDHFFQYLYGTPRPNNSASP